MTVQGRLLPRRYRPGAVIRFFQEADAQWFRDKLLAQQRSRLTAKLKSVGSTAHLSALLTRLPNSGFNIVKELRIIRFIYVVQVPQATPPDVVAWAVVPQPPHAS